MKTILKAKQLTETKKGNCSIPFINEDHVIWLKVPEQLLKGPRGETLNSVSSLKPNLVI